MSVKHSCCKSQVYSLPWWEVQRHGPCMSANGWPSETGCSCGDAHEVIVVRHLRWHDFVLDLNILAISVYVCFKYGLLLEINSEGVPKWGLMPYARKSMVCFWQLLPVVESMVPSLTISRELLQYIPVIWMVGSEYCQYYSWFSNGHVSTKNRGFYQYYRKTCSITE